MEDTEELTSKKIKDAASKVNTYLRHLLYDYIFYLPLPCSKGTNLSF